MEWLVEERGRLDRDKEEMKMWGEKLLGQGEEIDKTFNDLLVREKQVIDSYSELRIEKSNYLGRKERVEDLEKRIAEGD
jgi:hypothetical protein